MAIFYWKKTHLDFIYGILWIVATVCFAAIELTIYCIGMVSVTSESRYLTSTSVIKLTLDVHSRSDSTEFNRIGLGSSD